MAEFFSENPVPDDVRDAVIFIVKNISFKNEFAGSVSSPELDVVRDADRLDAIGAIGTNPRDSLTQRHRADVYIRWGQTPSYLRPGVPFQRAQRLEQRRVHEGRQHDGEPFLRKAAAAEGPHADVNGARNGGQAT